MWLCQLAENTALPACLPTRMNPLYGHHVIYFVRMCVCVCQLRIVSGRTMWNCLRNPQTSIGQLGLSIFFSILMGTIYYQIPLTLPEAVQNRYKSTENTCGSAWLLYLLALAIALPVTLPASVYNISRGNRMPTGSKHLNKKQFKI